MIKNEIVEDLGDRLIVATKSGAKCIIDRKFYEEAEGSICIGYGGYFKFYSNRSYCKLHRAVFSMFKPNADISDVDIHHKNELKDDNRMQNLIAMDRREHLKLHKIGKKRGFAKSKYFGVVWCKKRGQWRARFMVNGVHKTSGYFKAETEAAIRANEMIKEYSLDIPLNEI